jgi:choline dehydrogenase
MNSPRWDWRYFTEPEPELDGRRLHCPRGKVVGGSSSINGMVYVRGHPMDFEGWAADGARGWAWRDVLPYFKRAETCADGGDAYRGDSGPLHTSYGRLANPLYRTFVDAAASVGYARSDDLNGYRQEGFGRLDMTVHRGRRWSAASAYLRPALRRPNLQLFKRTLVTRIVFDGTRAVGVVCERRGKSFTLRARREVILSGGAINSPQLLKLSGVGSAAELRAHGIAPVVDRAAVGENLQDHLECYFQVACTKPITLYSSLGWRAKAAIGLRWLLRKDGLGASNHFEVGGFVRSAAGIPYPDIQFHFLSVAISYDGSRHVATHGFQAHVGPMRSKSRGHVRLRSRDPHAAPVLRFNYMSHPDDWMEMRAALHHAREIFAATPFDPYRGEELSPGSGARDDAALDAFIRAHAESAYHPCGTCRMGARDDPRSVVDPEGRVIGVDNLRVIDASIIPTITNGNLNAPTIMLAEKLADVTLGRTPLAADDQPFFIDPAWREQQRKRL